MNASLTILAGLLLLTHSALAATAADAGSAELVDDAETGFSDKVGAGSLLLKSPQAARLVLVPAIATHVRMRISGMVARVRVSQRFQNSADTWVEGVYVFPLPESAAVDRLRVRIGERLVEGRIKEREIARRIYDAAKRGGRRAVLIEQERPNIFTASVANIGPSDAINVEIEYQQSMRLIDGAFSLRFPMVVAPRFIPGRPLPRRESAPGFLATGITADTDRVPDASRITPPVRQPKTGTDNPVSLAVFLDAGFPLANVESPSHSVTIEDDDRGAVSVRFANGTEPADRDFVLTWSPRIGDEPRAALFTEEVGGETYAMLMVMPPKAPRTHTVLRREVIFVIDTSGSMGGASIRQAKRALALAIERLRDGDRFNVIEFNSNTRLLFDTPRPASRLSKEIALGWTSALDASGGTHMKPALEAALGRESKTRGVRQLVFLTDGAVGNEDALFTLIRQRLGTSRLFTVGIGSAPNGHFMRRAARFGRGSFTYIGALNQVGKKMETLFQKLETPVMHSLQIRWPETTRRAEVYPARLPDLYAGEPLVISARLPPGGRWVEVKGIRASESWRARIPLRGGRSQAGVGAVFARSKIAGLMDGAVRGADPGLIRQAVIDVALKHHLVSRYTSLVAVDVTPARPEGAKGTRHPVAVNLPAGWKYEKVFGPAPAAATPAQMHLLTGTWVTVLGLILLAGVRRRWRHPG